MSHFARMHECTNVCMSERMNECMDERMNKCVNECMNEGMMSYRREFFIRVSV